MPASAVVTVPRVASDFSALLAEVRRAHLLERSGTLYLTRLAITAVMIALGAVAFVWVGDSWWTLAVAAYFGGVFAQLGFLGHDAGHQQIFDKRRRNDYLGLLLSNVCVGLSYSWWIAKHNRHHRNPNEIGSDPDIDRNILAWTPEQATAQHGALAVIARHQAGFFFPLLTLEAFNLHVGSVRALIASRERHTVELLLLALHVIGGLTVLLLVLSPLHALAFFAVQQMVFGFYIGSSFAPNHKGMAIIDADNDWDFLRRQVLTSRNVAGGRILTAALGGLNYQIEHHLFPSMPSCNLRRCQPIVRRFCADHGVSYCEAGLFGSYGQALRYLHDLRPLPVP
jgi:fatty acid desaturase